LVEFCESVGRTIPSISGDPLSAGEVLYWRLNEMAGPVRMRVTIPLHESTIATGHANAALQSMPGRTAAALAQ